MQNEHAGAGDPVGDPLDDLSKLLAANHVHLAASGTASDLLSTTDPVEARRVVAVVGAGASKAAGLSGTQEAIVRLRRHIAEETLNRELDRLEWEYQLKRSEFETNLLAISRFAREQLLEDLVDMFGDRYRPSLTYELLAHLLKHRFIDAIINFNFDELLDQSLCDELGTGHYVHVVSDGDCPSDICLPDGRLKMPVYVKPHGTVGHPSTMRFTRGDYYSMPTGIRRVLRDLLAGRITLLVIGFQMQSFEFNRLASRHMDDDSRIFRLTWRDNPMPKPMHDEKLKRCCQSGGHIAIDENVSLDKRLEIIWKSIASKYKSYTPRGIERHKLICSLPQSNGAGPARAAYFLQRAYAEVALATAKSKGFVATRVLASGRAGRYFALWKEQSHDEPKTLAAMCKNLGLTECSYSLESLRLRGEGEEEPPPQAMLPEEFDAEAFAKVVSARSNIHNEQQLVKSLQAMFDHDEVEVVDAPEAMLHELFREPTTVSTLASLKVQTQKALAKRNWDTLLCVAETGEWLINERVFERERLTRMRLIVANRTQEDAIGFVRPKSVDFEMGGLQWWLHNQHMTLLLDGPLVRTAIYFERRLRSPRISPVILRGEDAQSLKGVFFAYWLKSDRGGHTEITPEQVHDEIRKFDAEVPTRGNEGPLVETKRLSGADAPESPQDVKDASDEATRT